MRNKKLCALCLLLVCLLLMSGCQLAREEISPEENLSSDLLVGVLITRDEPIWPEETDEAASPEEKEQLVDRLAYVQQENVFSERIYASLVSPVEGSSYQEYRFEGMDGIQFFVSRMEQENGDLYDTQTLYPDDSLVPDGRHIHVTDEAEHTETSATLYLLPEMFASAWKVNPVYQTPDGQVYAQPGGAGIMSSGLENEGARFTQTLEGSVSVTKDGQTETRSTRTEISFEMMYEPKNIVILQFDAQGTLLERQEYLPGQLPEELGTLHEAAYLIAETHKLSPRGETVVSRQLLQPGNETLQTFYAREDGICAAEYTALFWRG